MRQNPQTFFLIVGCILFAIDLYTYKGVRLLLSDMQNEILRKGLIIGFWGVTAIIFAIMAFIIINMDNIRTPGSEHIFFMFSGFLILTLAPKLVFVIFHLIEDISFLFYFVGNKIFSNPVIPPAVGERLSRYQFITRTGAFLSLIPFVSIGYGILKGRYNFRILKESITFPNLPKSFNGLRIVQISDLHIGSFGDDHNAVKKGIDLVNSLNPDIIFFTGDLVNNFADETDGWEEVLGSLKSKYGKFSVLGNHDYSDYIPWDSLELKQQNLEKVKQFHKKIGFRLLLNESESVTINNQSISVIGIENWGTGSFSKYGDLAKAMPKDVSFPFKILLSHDPSHWDAQVLGQTDIDLTLAGHTHGMQFGVSLGNFTYSPVQHRYPRWGGLYREDKQHLYVNRGFGFLGFPGRVGMPPEITLIELKA